MNLKTKNQFLLKLSHGEEVLPNNSHPIKIHRKSQSSLLSIEVKVSLKVRSHQIQLKVKLMKEEAANM